MAVFDKHAPIRQKQVKREKQPEWINDEIKTAIKQRNKYHGLKDWRQYKYWRNRITALIRKSKKNFFSRSINEHKDNTFLWRHVKSLSGQNDDRKVPDQIVIEDVSYQTENDIIEQLNCLFSTISDRLRSEDSETHDIANFYLKKLKDFVDSKVQRDVEFKIPFIFIRF